MANKKEFNLTKFRKDLRRTGKTLIIIGSAVVAIGAGIFAYDKYQTSKTHDSDLYRTSQRSTTHKERHNNPNINDIGGAKQQSEKDKETKNTDNLEKKETKKQEKATNTQNKKAESPNLTQSHGTTEKHEVKKNDDQYKKENVYNDAKESNIKVQTEDSKPAPQQTRAQTHSETGTQGEQMGGVEADVQRLLEEQEKQKTKEMNVSKEEKSEKINLKSEEKNESTQKEVKQTSPTKTISEESEIEFFN